MPGHIKTYFSCIVLAGTSLFILKRFPASSFFQWSKTAIQILFINSCLGIAKHGFQWNGADQILYYSKPLDAIFVFPLIVGQIWLNGGYRDFAMLHPILAFVPYIYYLNGQDYVETTDFVITLSMMSCVIISIETGNAYGIMLTVLIGIANSEKRNDFTEEQSRDIYNYLMCFFEIIAVKAIERVQIIYV